VRRWKEAWRWSINLHGSVGAFGMGLRSNSCGSMDAAGNLDISNTAALPRENVGSRLCGT